MVPRYHVAHYAMGGERAVAVNHVVFKVGGERLGAMEVRWKRVSGGQTHSLVSTVMPPFLPPAAAAAAGAARLHRPPAGLHGLGRRWRVRVQPRIHGGLAW